MKILNHLQHRQQRAGMVRQGKGKQDNPGIAAAVRQVPLPGEGLLHRLELGFLPLHVQEKHMGVHGLVIADPVDIGPRLGNGTDRPQEGSA